MSRLLLCLMIFVTALPLWAKPRPKPKPMAPLKISRDLNGQLLQLTGLSKASDLTWKNPKVGDPGVLSRDGYPEGLTLVGADGRPTDRLDPTKGIAIYVHGWTPEGGFVPQFIAPDQWRQAGFNPMVYRWHVRSHGDFFKADEQARKGPVIDELVANITLLRQKLDRGKPGSYTGEIRLIGYSAGAWVALQAAKQCFYDDETYAMSDWLNKRLRRVDLLEPAFVDEFVRADSVSVAGYQHTKVMTTKEINKDVGVPTDLASFGIKVVAFTSAMDKTLAPTLDKSIPTQKMNTNWTIGGQNDIESQHVAVPNYYFTSINKPLPPTTNKQRKAFSAATPTASLRQGRTLTTLTQVKGTQTQGIGDDAYFEEKVESNRGGVLVDQDPFYQDTVRGGSNAGIVIPVFQR